MELVTIGPSPRPSLATLLKSGIIGTFPLGGTLAHLPISSLTAREAQGHMQQLELSVDAPVYAIAREELERARALDPRVCASDMARAIDRAAAAAELEARPQDNLFGFTRCNDARFALTGERFSAIVSRVAERFGLEEVGKALGGATSEHKTVNVIAKMTRQLREGDGASLQLSISREDEEMLRSLFTPDEFTLVMGGAGAFGANASAAQGAETTFVAPDGLPEGIVQRLHDEVSVVDENGVVTPPEGAIDQAQELRTNYIAEYRKGEPMRLLAGTPWETSFAVDGSSRIILSTPGSQEIHFGDASNEALQRMIAGKDLLFFAGTHYLTRDPADADKLAGQLAVMKAAEPGCLFHLQYVVPKVPENEVAVLTRLAPQVDSMSLNAVEVPALMDRFRSAGLTTWSGAAVAERDVMEHPRQLLDNGMALAEAMDLKRLQMHGMHGDFVIMPTPQDKDRQVLALMRARQIASMKAGNDSGEIKAEGDHFEVLPVVEGSCLAMVHQWADAMAERFGAPREALVRDWYWDDGQGRTIFFVPSRGIHERTGGTVSLGDTIDAMALVYGKE